MPSASIKKEIACSKENLIKMVLDIEKYPEFVPWCLNGKIHSRNDREDRIEITADLTIGKSFFNETYKSFVIYKKTLDEIHVTNIDGPLKHLENKWFFISSGVATTSWASFSYSASFFMKNNIVSESSFFPKRISNSLLIIGLFINYRFSSSISFD